jgi:hypothetical protein
MLTLIQVTNLRYVDNNSVRLNLIWKNGDQN